MDTESTERRNVTSDRSGNLPGSGEGVEGNEPRGVNARNVVSDETKAFLEKRDAAKRLQQLNKKMRKRGLTAKEKNERADIKARYHFSLELEQEKVERAAERYMVLIDKYGAIAPGENPARDVPVPKRTADNQKVSQTVRTILEAGATPEEIIPDIERLVADGDFSYEKHTDKQAISNAENTIRRVGWAQALSDWMGDVKSGTLSCVRWRTIRSASRRTSRAV